jgi:hypothetical protein
MSSRSVIIQGALAMLAMLFAYATWQREPELITGEVFVLELTKNDLQKVRFEDQEAKTWNELSKDRDSTGTFVTLRLSGYDNTSSSMPAGHPGVVLKMPERLVRGSETAQRLFDKFAPLRGKRALGVLDAGKAKELGLDTSKKFLEVTARGVKRRFAIAPAPPGGSDPYIKDVQDNRVYVLDRPILTDLQAASTNLIDRRLHAFKIEELDRVVLTGGAKRKEFVASRIEEFPGIRLAPKETPDKPDATIKNWHDRIFGLFPTEVLGKGETPASGAPNVTLKLEYFSRGRLIGWAELARTKPPAPPPASSASTTPPPPPPSPEVLVRSEHTLGWYRVTSDSNNLLTEGENLVNKK